MVFLTKDPGEVLDFIGLDRGVYWREGGFATEEEMFEYVRGMRFFNKRVYENAKLKANDRKRMKKREVFRRFVAEWVPSLEEAVEDEAGGDRDVVKERREAAFNEALDRWGKRECWMEMKKSWNEDRDELSAKRLASTARRESWIERNAYADAWTTAIRIEDMRNAGDFM